MRWDDIVMANDLDSLKRGDLVFWDGHVGIMTDSATLLHANGHHMMVVAEPLKQAVERIAPALWADHQHQAALIAARAVNEIGQRFATAVFFDVAGNIGADRLGSLSAAQCGVTVTFGCVHSGLSAGNGSGVKTSSVAAWSSPASSAAMMSSAICWRPRPALMMIGSTEWPLARKLADGASD